MKRGDNRKRKKELRRNKGVKRFLKVTEIFVSLIFLCILCNVLFNLLFAPNIEVVSGEQKTLGAHRGNSKDFMENTLPAFKSAIEDERYKFIEFDVQYTKDKKAVVHHDSSLLRLQGKNYQIIDLTYEELLNVSDYHIPLYEEVMDLIGDKKPINVEIKSQKNESEEHELVDFVVLDLKNRGILDKTLLSSISSNVLTYVNEKYPEIKTGKVYLVTSSTFLHLNLFTSNIYEETSLIHADYILLHGVNLGNYNSLKELLPHDKTLIIWYFDDEVYVIDREFYNDEFRALKPGFYLEKCHWWC